MFFFFPSVQTLNLFNLGRLTLENVFMSKFELICRCLMTHKSYFKLEIQSPEIVHLWIMDWGSNPLPSCFKNGYKKICRTWVPNGRIFCSCKNYVRHHTASHKLDSALQTIPSLEMCTNEKLISYILPGFQVHLSAGGLICGHQK